MTNDECRMGRGPAVRSLRHSSFVILFLAVSAQAQTNSILSPVAVPDAGASLLRVLGALALVIGLFLGGAWLVRNWQRLARQQGGSPKLNVLEIRSLGGRQAIYVVGYEQERFLLASSPAGVNFLTHLPGATADTEQPTATKSPVSFSQALAQVLKGK
ncbi:MAG TPA: flagellar biosynthetic protein FliO [Verrucomicrobiae bacterium]|nr:flagellar biosynthetic protein FliO [Verrucomicrobiae bacterium]